MSQGVADQVSAALGKDPLSMTRDEWFKVALSGKGMYVPLVRNETEFHSFTPGAHGQINEKGEAFLQAAVGMMETSIINFHSKNEALFMKRFGHPPDPVEPNRIADTRSKMMEYLVSVPEKERRGRDLDYTLVVSGGLRPWAKQISAHIQNIETKEISNRKSAERDVANVINDRPLLRHVIDTNWRKDVVNGKMTRYEHDRLRAKYFKES